MKLTHTFTVPAPPDRVWTFLMDVPAMAQCIPGVSAVTPVDATTYDSTVTTKIGPITARFACRIAVLDLDEAARTGHVEVAGKDVKLGGGVKSKMAMALVPDGDGTAVTIDSDVDIMGKIGQYGHGMIAKRADAMLADFAACVRDRIDE
jgi:carbon monoxide dehydrogenase subunit G